VASWCAGAPVADRPRARLLARRLLDAGLFHPQPPPGGPPAEDVTVVVPVKDRADALRACLAGLGRLSPVVVVDDGSDRPQEVAAVATSAGARYVHRAVNGGPGAARNTGVRACETPLLAFVDSDCVPSAGWLAGLLPHFADPVVGAVAPRIVALDSHGALAAYEGVRSPLDMGSREASARPDGAVPYVPSAALVVRREALGSGFDEALRLGEDVDLIWRVVDAGWIVRYVPSITVAHAHRVRPVAWLRRRVAYNTAAAELAGRHPGTLFYASASRWSLLGWVAAAAGQPLTAFGATTLAVAMLRRRLTPRVSHSGPLAARIVIRGVLRDGESLAGAARGPWLPLLLGASVRLPRLRTALLAAFLVPPAVDWVARRPRLGIMGYILLRGVDDVARGVGLWAGCLRAKTLTPLLPRVVGRPAGLDLQHGLRAMRAFFTPRRRT
jgi:mycofactocin system glycosyltransferase